MKKSIHFQTLDLKNFHKCFIDLKMGTISDMTYKKTILTFLSIISKHSLLTHYAALVIVKLLIYILHLFTINVFYKPPEEKLKRSQNLRMGERGNGSPSFGLTMRELPIQKGINLTEVRLCTI